MISINISHVNQVENVLWTNNPTGFHCRYFLARSPGMQRKESPSSPVIPTSTGNPSRSRQLWARAVESVLEQEKTSPTTNEPIGWYNLTKR